MDLYGELVGVLGRRRHIYFIKNEMLSGSECAGTRRCWYGNIFSKTKKGEVCMVVVRRV